MNIFTIRQALRTGSIFDIKLTVTFYARVSSDSDEQINSLGNQIKYYTDFIKKNPNWTFVPGYIDEGLSGATANKREDFQRMIEDAKQGSFDLIITKEITRFARNTLDSILYTRELLEHGVGVFFQNDNINTFDEDSELRLTIMSGIAQDELRKLSSRVKFGHQQAIKNGVVLGNSRIFGYRKDKGRLVIDEEEAEMVRLLFDLYSSGNYSMKQIENIFWEKGYRNHNGNKIAHTTMSGMIANPKYKGYYVGNKVKVVDLFSKKQEFLPPDKWVMYKDETGNVVPAIVSEEVWNLANEVLKRRSEDVKNRQGVCNHANIFTGKLFCTHCGLPYYRRESKDKQGNVNSKWVCSGKIKNGSDSCPSFAIFENELKPLISKLFSEKDDEETCREAFEEYLQIFQDLCRNQDYTQDLEEIERKIEVIEKKKQKLLSYNALDQLSDSDFLKMNNQLTEELNALIEKRDALSSEKMSEEDIQRKVKELRARFDEITDFTKMSPISKNFVDNYINGIYVTPNEDRRTANLDIRIFTGDSFKGTMKSRTNCTGHMSKKMIESYEKNL